MSFKVEGSAAQPKIPDLYITGLILQRMQVAPANRFGSRQRKKVPKDSHPNLLNPCYNSYTLTPYISATANSSRSCLPHEETDTS